MADKIIQVKVNGRIEDITVTVNVSDTTKTNTSRQGRKEPLPFHFGPGTTVYGF